MLIDTESGLEVVQISVTVIILTVVIIALLFSLLAFLVVRAHRRKVTTGSQGLIGETAEVYEKLEEGKTGLVKIHGELWNAEISNTAEKEIPAGAKVKITEVNNLTLKVKTI